MPLSTDNLRCFAEAARLLNFRSAARAVALSPAALGQRIRQIEDELGVRLFHRTTRAVVLTEAGQNLVPYVDRALAAVEDCRRVGRGELGPAPMDLVLGTRHELGLSYIVPLIDSVERKQPGLTLHLYFGSGPDLVMRVRSLAIDCAVTSSRITDPKLDDFRLHDERYSFVGSPALLRRQPLRSGRDARHHTLFDVTEELPLFRYLRDAPGGIDSRDFSRVIRLGTIAAIRQQVLRGRGVAVLPEYFIARDLQAGRLVVLLPRVRPIADFFRLIFRVDDPRRGVYSNLADFFRARPLR